MKKTRITKRRWLFLPIETKVRELTGKTLLACVAAESGWGVVVGHKKTVRGKQNLLPRGTFIEKSISPGRITDIEKAQKYGNRLSAWCEEGLIYLNREDYSQGRLEPQSFEAIDLFFAWGKHQADDVQESLGGHEKIVLSGNPRFDLLRPDLRNIFSNAAEDIRRQYGNIILLNTKFSMVNNNRNIKDFNYLEFMRSIGKIKTKEKEDLVRRYVTLNRKLFTCFQDLIPLLSKNFPNHLIVVRPHPSENHAPWLEKANNLPNVQVIFRGNVNEWLIAADIMVHNNCTTGVEAFLLGRPAISYRPVKDQDAEHELPDRVSFRADEPEDLLELVKRFVSDKKSISQGEHNLRKNFASKYIANIDGMLASDTIVQYLNKLDLPLAEGFFPVNKNLKSIIENNVKQFERRIRQQFDSTDSVKTVHYNQQKFPGIKFAEMKQILDEIRIASGRFQDLQIIPVDDNAFCIFRP